MPVAAFGVLTAFTFLTLGALGVAAMPDLATQVPPLWFLPVPPVNDVPLGQAIADADAKPNAAAIARVMIFFMVVSLNFAK